MARCRSRTGLSQQLQLAVARDDVPHALLFTGPESVGKMTLARILTAALLCKGSEAERPCGVCLACRKLDSGNHPDFMLVAPEPRWQQSENRPDSRR